MQNKDYCIQGNLSLIVHGHVHEPPSLLPSAGSSMHGVPLSDDGATLLITSSTDDSMALLSVTSTLRVTSVVRESAFPTIACTASNGVGSNSSDSIQRIVMCNSFIVHVVDVCPLVEFDVHIMTLVASSPYRLS